MKKIYLIGIGPGDPRYLTQQAIETMRDVDVFFILEKESERNRELVKIREGILERYLPGRSYRIVTAKIPERSRGGRGLEVYKERVDSWRKQKADVLAGLIENEMNEGEAAALLVWGDPSLYDGHIEILDYILREKKMDFEFEVIPGITSIQVLTARHKIPLNQIGEGIAITTSRALRELPPSQVSNNVVLLDNFLTYRNFRESDLHIYWGAYLGSPDEIIISGKLNDILDDLIKVRNGAKKKKGWIMETYILRRQRGEGEKG